MNKTIMTLALPFILGSCGIYSRYSRPELAVDVDSLYRQPAAMADTSALASMTWQELFTDPLLQGLVATALDRNTDLAVARLQVEEAQAALTNARLAYLPSVSLTPQGGISHFNGDTKKTYSLGATASWEVETFGQLTNAKREAKAALMESEAYAQAVQTQLVATVAESYYALLLLDEKLSISRQTLENWDSTIVTLTALAAAGRTNEVAVHQAQANRTALEASILTIRQSISETENSLCALLKETPHPIERGTLQEQSFPDNVGTGLPIQMVAGRPDVRQAEMQLAAAFYATNAAHSAFYPSLTLSGTVGFTNSGGTVVNPGKWLTSALAQLTAPLFNRGTNIANLRIAKARQQEALLLFEQKLLDAGNEVNDALVAWQTADGRIALDEKQVAELQTATEKTEYLVRYTSANYLEVLTAQQSLLNARLTLAQDRISKIQSVIQLYHALGPAL